MIDVQAFLDATFDERAAILMRTSPEAFDRALARLLMTCAGRRTTN